MRPIKGKKSHELSKENMNALEFSHPRSHIHEFCSKHFICGSIFVLFCHLVNFILCVIYYESKLPSVLVLVACLFNIWWCLFRLSLMKYYSLPHATDWGHVVVSCSLHCAFFTLLFLTYFYYFSHYTVAAPQLPAFALCAPLSFTLCIMYNFVLDAFLFIHPPENEDEFVHY